MKNDTWRVYPTDGGSTKKLILEMHINSVVRPSFDVGLCKEFIPKLHAGSLQSTQKSQRRRVWKKYLFFFKK
jgi:hypothetical protein